MGDPKRLRSKYETPSHPWQKARIEAENEQIRQYALKNKKEIWIAQSKIRKFRHQARTLVGLPQAQREKDEKTLIGKLQRLGVLRENGTLDDILSLRIEDILERRLQTLVWKKNMARTAAQARQFVVHGHISVGGRKVDVPGAIIGIDGEKAISWYGNPVVTPESRVKAMSATVDAMAKEVKPTPEEAESAENVVEETGATETLKHISRETEEAPKKAPKEAKKEKKPRAPKKPKASKEKKKGEGE